MSEDRRGAIEAAFESATEPEQAAPEAEVSPGVESSSETQVADAGGERREYLRDEKGKFAAAEAAAVAQAEKQARKYPSSWRKELEPKFRRIEADPELADLLDEIDRRENDFHKGLEPYKQKAEYAERLERALGGRTEALRAQYGDEAAAIQHLMQLSDFAAKDPVNFINWFAQQRGISLGGQRTEAAADPAGEASPEVRALLDRIGNMERQIEAGRQQEQNAKLLEMQAIIDNFAADKPQWKVIEDDILYEVQKVRAQRPGATPREWLQEAYDRALYANPTTRADMLAQQQAKAEAERREKAQQAAAAAKAAAVSVKGAPPMGANTPDPKNRRALIEAALDKRV